uniref:Uncharacterized protein n=1 Tax=Chromera velia CCMP2878 TaxID=1169474 RepID=A0A0G4FYV7_9ALVE|eukprot:Cvel_3945.t1-p1 / transcript=Cvel_3945.t1 / gene=Cvel_3945 / organism=Chromera_velia_CCMP2878 / gene_product=Haloacid dehalogenase-like hydrolase, putative / transcript_product=Haloacid dehalogenase-like hydrolase, putative / location=Cvel_scaffold167:87368-93472(+) / protein_length=286 / sequence_SO=supercontig / SO=protein_coding / is_pseudo=false
MCGGTLETLKALKRLQEHCKVVIFVTNTTSESRSALLEKVQSLGLSVSEDCIFSSLSAAADLVRTRKRRPFLLLKDAAKEEFPDLIQTEKIPLDSPLPTEGDRLDTVVVGLAPQYFSEEFQTAALRILLKEDAQLIAVHKGRTYQAKDGLHIGPGALVSGLEFSTGKKAEVVGKPSRAFFDAAILRAEAVMKQRFGDSDEREGGGPESSLAVDRKRVVMIGDDARDDVKGAIAAGLNGLLVRTGKYREGEEKRAGLLNENGQPLTGFLGTAENFSAAVDCLLLGHT